QDSSSSLSSSSQQELLLIVIVFPLRLNASYICLITPVCYGEISAS
ncbi:unnamed protein product, partial [Brassica rapa subsp. narinosa]